MKAVSSLLFLLADSTAPVALFTSTSPSPEAVRVRFSSSKLSGKRTLPRERDLNKFLLSCERALRVSWSGGKKPSALFSSYLRNMILLFSVNEGRRLQKRVNDMAPSAFAVFQLATFLHLPSCYFQTSSVCIYDYYD